MTTEHDMVGAIRAVEAELASNPALVLAGTTCCIQIVFDVGGWKITAPVSVRTKSGKPNKARRTGRALGFGETLSGALVDILKDIELKTVHTDLV